MQYLCQIEVSACGYARNTEDETPFPYQVYYENVSLGIGITVTYYMVFLRRNQLDEYWICICGSGVVALVFECSCGVVFQTVSIGDGG